MSIKCKLFLPERIIFGNGVAQQVGECVKDLKGKRVFLVTDKGVAGLDAFKDVENSLKKEAVDYYIYAEVGANPTDTQVERGARLYKEEKADVLVAVGGGSSIDSAKAIGILVNNGGSIQDYAGVDLFENLIPPLIAIPTTAGTGSEVGIWAMINNTKDNYKMGPGGWKLLPKVALVDPMMMVSAPPLLTAATGMDALSHAVEAYCTPYAMPQTDALAIAAIRLIVKHLGPAVANGSNLEAREGMAMGSLEAGMAFSSSGCGAVHALGHQLSTQYGMPHGMAMAIMMPPVMKFNMIACVDRLADIAVAMGEQVDRLSIGEAAEKAILAVRRLGKSIGLPTTLSEYGADQKLMPNLVKWASRDADLPANPRVPTLEQIEELYRKAFAGSLG